MSYETKETCGTILAIIGIIVFMVITIIFVDAAEKSSTKNEWNDGICKSCNNGHYEFTSADGKNSYYYKCNNCDHVEQFSQIME